MVIFWGIFYLLFGFFLFYSAKKKNENILTLLGILAVVLGVYFWLNYFFITTAFSASPKKAVVYVVHQLEPLPDVHLPQQTGAAWLHPKYKMIPSLLQRNHPFALSLADQNISLKYVKNQLPSYKKSSVSECVFVSLDAHYFKEHLQEISSWIDQNKDLLILVLSTETSSFSPLYMFRPEIKPSLTSNSTRRNGLVTDADLVASLYTYFNTSMPTSINGFPIESIERKIFLEPQLFQWKTLYYIRYICLGLWISLLFLWIYRPNLFFTYALFCFPIIGLIAGLLFKTPWLYVLFLIAGLWTVHRLIRFNPKSTEALPLLIYINLFILLFMIFFLPEGIYNSPFGYNNLIKGGRFYGINNDFMGILIGHALIISYSWYKENKKVLSLGLLLLTLLSLSPFFGANVGGSLTVLFLFCLLAFGVGFTEKKTGFFQWFLILGIIITIELLIGTLDLYKQASIGHLGRFLENILIHQLPYTIVSSKIKQVLWMMILPPWNIIPIIEILYIKRHRLHLHPLIKLAVLTSIFAALTNDTGMISACFILTYAILYVKKEPHF